MATNESLVAPSDIGAAASAASASDAMPISRTPECTRFPRAERGEAVRVPISEEQVKVGKREVEQGAAKIRKEVRTERVNTPVDLKREKLVIERTDAKSGDVPADAFKEEEIRVPLMKEEAVVQKEAKVVGEVRVGKKERTERENVSETIRKEDVKIDDKGTKK